MQHTGDKNRCSYLLIFSFWFLTGGSVREHQLFKEYVLGQVQKYYLNSATSQNPQKYFIVRHIQLNSQFSFLFIMSSQFEELHTFLKICFIFNRFVILFKMSMESILHAVIRKSRNIITFKGHLLLSVFVYRDAPARSVYFKHFNFLSETSFDLIQCATSRGK